MGKPCSCIEIVQKKHPAKLYNYGRVPNKKNH